MNSFIFYEIPIIEDRVGETVVPQQHVGAEEALDVLRRRMRLPPVLLVRSVPLGRARLVLTESVDFIDASALSGLAGPRKDAMSKSPRFRCIGT